MIWLVPFMVIVNFVRAQFPNLGSVDLGGAEGHIWFATLIILFWISCGWRETK